jgi:hypothetical protein
MTRNERRALRLSFWVAFAASRAGFARFPRQAKAVFRVLLYAVVFPEVALIVVAVAVVLVMGVWDLLFPPPPPWWCKLPGWPPDPQFCPKAGG